MIFPLNSSKGSITEIRFYIVTEFYHKEFIICYANKCFRKVGTSTRQKFSVIIFSHTKSITYKYEHHK
jgi:hypothetical protein